MKQKKVHIPTNRCVDGNVVAGNVGAGYTGVGSVEANAHSEVAVSYWFVDTIKKYHSVS